MLRALQSRAVVWLAAVAGTLAACGGDDSSGPIVPASVTIVAGHDQSGPIGATLLEPLTVLVRGSDNQPFAGSTIEWLVTAGGGSITPQTSVTDAQGQASATLTLGVNIGPNTATATVSGLTPASFTAHAVHPCDYDAPFAAGTPANGTLATLDCQLGDGSFIDYHGLTVGAQQALSITLTSVAFETFLWLFDDLGPIAVDGGGGAQAQILAIVGPNSYRIGANAVSAGESGAYTLSAAPVSENLGGCDVVWATVGIATSQQLTTTDCDGGSGFYADIVVIVLRAGQTITVDQHSSEFDAFLGLADLGSQTIVATDDDSGPGTDARLAYTASAEGLFLIIATSFDPATGAYTLGIQ